MENWIVVGVKMSRGLLGQIDEVGMRIGEPRAQFIRHAIAEYLERNHESVSAFDITPDRRGKGGRPTHRTQPAVYEPRPTQNLTMNNAPTSSETTLDPAKLIEMSKPLLRQGFREKGLPLPPGLEDGPTSPHTYRRPPKAGSESTRGPSGPKQVRAGRAKSGGASS